MSRVPNRLYLDLTNRCNMRCLHCSVNAGDELPNLLTDEELRDLLVQARDMGIERVVFSGGEPLIRPGVHAILDAAVECGHSVTVLTNGTLIDADSVRFFRERGISIKISLDGATAETHDYLRGSGAFGRVMEVFHLLKDGGLGNRSAHFTVHRKNLHELSSLPALLDRIEVRTLVVGTMKPAGRAAINSELVLPPAMIPYVRRIIALLKVDRRIRISEFTSKGWKGFGCPAVCDKFGITADGRATTCVFLGSAHLGGSIRDSSLRELWGQYQATGSCFVPNPTCAACEWLETTGGGCRARALSFHGDINAPDPYCCAMKEHRAFLDGVATDLSVAG